MSFTGHNNGVRARILREIETLGVMETARWYGVNHYYICMIRDNPNYVPRNTEIATKLGFKVYRTSVPHGTPKKQKRCTIYPGTSVEKIRADLLDVTGVEWHPLVDEMEY